MSYRGFHRAVLFLMIAVLPHTAHPQGPDCTQFGCERNFEKMFKSDSCELIVAYLQGDDELFSSYGAHFAMGCVGATTTCEQDRDRTPCSSYISWDPTRLTDSRTYDQAYPPCLVRWTETRSGGCMENEAVYAKDCGEPSNRAGMCFKYSYQCNDEDGLFGSFGANCRECGLGPAYVDEIRTAAYSAAEMYVARSKAALATAFDHLGEEEKEEIVGWVEAMVARRGSGSHCFDLVLADTVNLAALGAATPTEDTEITIDVLAEGFEPSGHSWVIRASEPSTISVSGRVLDTAGTPIPDARIRLEALDVTVTSGPDGTYSLQTQAAGTTPFSVEWDFRMTPVPAAVRLEITVNDSFLPVPGTISVQLEGTDDSGRPLAGHVGSLTIVDGYRAPFVMLNATDFTLDANGRFTATVSARKPLENDIAFIEKTPLRITLKAEIRKTSVSPPVAADRVEIPLGLYLIHGVTVGPDMKGRYNEVAPLIFPGTHFVLSSTIVDDADRTEPEGDFYVLGRLPTDAEKSRLAGGTPPNLWWKGSVRLPLRLPVDLPTAPGAVLDIGSVDLLDPSEHRQRLISWTREFISEMSLTGPARSTLLANLDGLPFKTGSGRDVPSYQSTTLDARGWIDLPGQPGDYWADNLMDVAAGTGDPAYAVTAHELGHFIHSQLIESLRLKAFYNVLKCLGSSHSTWAPPDTGVTAAQKIVSFNEATADFFASLLITFVAARHPEFTESPYFNLGYLEEFTDDSKARAVSSKGGCRIEGVQTTFLRTLYGTLTDSAGPAVFSDYLRTMLERKGTLSLTPWAPARTMPEWVAMKTTHRGMSTAADPTATARRFNIMPCAEGRQILINSRTASTTFSINGTPVRSPNGVNLHDLLVGDRVEITSGMVTITVIEPDQGNRAVVTAREGTSLRIVSEAEIEVSAGLVGIEGDITISTPTTRLTPRGTVWTVEVKKSGETTVGVFEGTVVAETQSGPASLASGQAGTVGRRTFKRVSLSPNDPRVAGLLTVPSAPEVFSDLRPTVNGAVPAHEPPASTLTSPSAETPPPGALLFYAVYRKIDGACVVVAGEEGITAGDTIYGAFPSYAAAEAEIGLRCTPNRPAAAAPPNTPVSRSLPLTTDRLYHPDSTVTRGRWGQVVHINEDPAFRGKLTERDVTIEDGLFVHPGQEGDTEIRYGHDGSAVTFSGLATVIDCAGYCGRAGAVVFSIHGDERVLWNSGIVRQDDPARRFEVSLAGVHTLTLIINDGGNGLDEDWGAWLNLRVGNGVSVGAGPTVAAKTPSNIVVPRFDNDDSTRGLYLFDLSDGAGRLFKRVRKTPLDIQPAPLGHTLFEPIRRSGHAGPGRVLAGPIRSGSGRLHALLIVDTTSGNLGYLAGLDDDPTGGRVMPFAGSPAADLRSNDGAFALIMRRSSRGKTLGAYLYNGTTGQCRLFKNIGDLATDGRSEPATDLPTTGPGLTAVEVHSGNEATTHFLLIDSASGALHLIGGVEKKPTHLISRTLPVNLLRSFPEGSGGSGSQRFVPVPITDRSGATESILIIDADSGGMAFLEDFRDTSRARLVGARGSVFDLLRIEPGRTSSLAAAAKIDDTGITEGVWVFEPATGEIVFLNLRPDRYRPVIRRVTAQP